MCTRQEVVWVLTSPVQVAGGVELDEEDDVDDDEENLLEVEELSSEEEGVGVGDGELAFDSLTEDEKEL